jgi:CBS domain-containing protein
MKANEIMTPTPATCTPDTTARQAAQLMERHDCGALPVVEEGSSRLIGVVTDRDLVVRGLAKGLSADTPVRELMTGSPHVVRPEDDLDRVEELMAREQIRRVPVVDSSGRCVGVIAQADLARALHAVGRKDFGKVLERISEPAGSQR